MAGAMQAAGETMPKGDDHDARGPVSCNATLAGDVKEGGAPSSASQWIDC
jgi:hypothetical protein